VTVTATTTTYIGPAANENPRGTADTTALYIGYNGMEAAVGHKPASDCDYTHPGYLGVTASNKYRSGATIQAAVTHGAYEGLIDCLRPLFDHTKLSKAISPCHGGMTKW